MFVFQSSRISFSYWKKTVAMLVSDDNSDPNAVAFYINPLPAARTNWAARLIVFGCLCFVSAPLPLSHQEVMGSFAFLDGSSASLVHCRLCSRVKVTACAVDQRGDCAVKDPICSQAVCTSLTLVGPQTFEICMLLYLWVVCIFKTLFVILLGLFLKGVGVLKMSFIAFM